MLPSLETLPDKKDASERKSALLLGGLAAEKLFARLPEKLFSPLASSNRKQYWTLLCALHRKRFGADAPLAPPDGFALRELTRDLEELLYQMDAWESEESEGGEQHDEGERAEFKAEGTNAGENESASGTSLNIRANMVLQRLVDSGWLRIDRHGLDRRISMAPSVTHFLSNLIHFAETGPLFVAGKIRSIEANIKLVMDGGEGDSLQEAAEQTRNLLEHVRSTGTNVRDLMETLTPELTTAQYARTFFTSYVEEIFIGDYKTLRTKDHPLSRRMQILEQVERLAVSDVLKERLLAWYRTHRASGDVERAKKLLDKDLDRLRDLSRIDEYLDRLDSEIRRANRRALAFLDYRIRALRPLDTLIDAAIAAALMASDNTQGAGGKAGEILAQFAPGVMVKPEMLAEPRQQRARAPADTLRRTQPSPIDLARIRIMMQAREARAITAPKLAEFIERQQANSADVLTSDDFRIETVSDLCALQSLMSLSMAMNSNSKRLRDNARILARGFRVVQKEGMTQDALISGTRFEIEKNQKGER